MAVFNVFYSNPFEKSISAVKNVKTVDMMLYQHIFPIKQFNIACSAKNKKMLTPGFEPNLI